MDSSTLPEAPDGAGPHSAGPHSAGPHRAPPLMEPRPPGLKGLGAEVRESVVLLSLAVGVTVGLTTAAQAAASLLA